MQSVQDNIYVQCVNRVLDYVYTHIDEELSLATLANIAGFSEFHFHRIFKSVVGETLNQFVWRVRVERGATMLRADSKKSVSDVAFDCGFTSLAGFSRAFKARFGLSPTQWNRTTRLQGEIDPSTGLFESHITELRADDKQFNVEIRQLPRQKLAYIRVHDSYKNDGRIQAAYHKLIAWYQAKSGHLDDTTLYGMSMDDPEITPLELCRYDWGLRVPDDWYGDGEISIREFPACTIAVVPIVGGDLSLEVRILQYMWRYWMPNSRYQPADLPGMEIYHHFPTMPDNINDWGEIHLDCAIPVTRL